MKKFVLVLLGTVCVLAVVQSGSNATYASETAQIAMLADYMGSGSLDLAQGVSLAGHHQASALITSEVKSKLPEPATLFLFGLGLLGLASFKRRFKG